MGRETEGTWYADLREIDKNYRFEPESYEMPFILSKEGLRWVRVFDPARRLYELTDVGRQQLDFRGRKVAFFQHVFQFFAFEGSGADNRHAE